MAVKYPMGKERPRGRCYECGGQVVLRWRDKLQGEYFCRDCGLVSSVAGYQDYVSKADIRRMVDECYGKITRGKTKRLSVVALMGVVDVLSLRRYGKRIGGITERDLTEWGYCVSCGLIERV
jgi:hypothetical protein